MHSFLGVLIAAVGIAGTLAQTASAADAAARLTAANGNVFVTQTTKTVRAQDGMSLYPGDRLALLQGSTLILVYGNGCSVPLSGASTVTIGAMPSCGTQSASAQVTVSDATAGAVTPNATPLLVPARRASR